MSLLLQIVLASTSAARMKQYGERWQACLTPLRGWKNYLTSRLEDSYQFFN